MYLNICIATDTALPLKCTAVKVTKLHLIEVRLQRCMHSLLQNLNLETDVLQTTAMSICTEIFNKSADTM